MFSGANVGTGPRPKHLQSQFFTLDAQLWLHVAFQGGMPYIEPKMTFMELFTYLQMHNTWHVKLTRNFIPGDGILTRIITSIVTLEGF